MPPCQRITVRVEGCPIQAILNCVSLVLMFEMGHCVTKALFRVSWTIPVVFQSMRDSNLSLLKIALFELDHLPVTSAIPRLCTFVLHIEITTFKLSKQCLTCSN